MNPTKRKYLYLILIILVASALRFNHLFDKAPGTDEINSIENSKNVFAHNFMLEPPLLGTDLFPPLFYILGNLVINIFYTENSLKVLMVMFGILSIIAFYFLVKEIFDTKLAIVAVTLMAFSPMHIIYSKHIRQYMPLIFLYILSVLFLYRFLFKEDQKSLIYLLITYILSVYLHYFSLLFIGAHFLIVWVFKIRKKIKVKNYIYVIVATFLALLTLTPLITKQYVAAQSLQSIPSFKSIYLFYPFYKFSSMLDFSEILNIESTILIIPLFINILVIYGFFRSFKQKNKAIFLSLNLLIPILSLAIVSIFLQVFSFRYLVFLLPIYLIFLSHSLYSKNFYLRKGLFILIILMWLWVIYYYYSNVIFVGWVDKFAL